jgi:integrase
VSAKVQFDRGAWWVITHHEGRRRRRRVGPSKADKRAAEEIAKKINAAIALGTYLPDRERPKPLLCLDELWKWHRAYAPTMKRSYEKSSAGVIRNHLVPAFGTRDLRDLRERDLLAFVERKVADGLAPNTIRNALAVLRRVYSLAQREGLVTLNPAARIGELMRRVGRRLAPEAEEVQAWTREEVERLLTLADEHEPSLAPLLRFLLATGCRRGEAVALR